MTLKRGSFSNVGDWIDPVEEYVSEHNRCLTPLIWITSAEVNRTRARLNKSWTVGWMPPGFIT